MNKELIYRVRVYSDVAVCYRVSGHGADWGFFDQRTGSRFFGIGAIPSDAVISQALRSQILFGDSKGKYSKGKFQK